MRVSLGPNAVNDGPGVPISAVPLDYLLQPFPVNLLTFSEDRLYLASYIHPPNEDTLFPYPDGPVKSPTKRSQRAGNGPQAVPKSPYKQPYYFTVDDTLLYNNFHHDFGPLHIGHLYRFALQFHEILGAKENKDRPVVFWSRADPRSTYPRPRAWPTVFYANRYPRPRQCIGPASLLYGPDPVLAATLGPGTHCPGRSSIDALSRRWI